MTHFDRWLIRALIHISRQIHSCESKLNKLLAHQGEDAQLLKLTERLTASDDKLQAAIDNQNHKPITPTQKDK
jgi:hypothetical protein